MNYLASLLLFLSFLHSWTGSTDYRYSPDELIVKIKRSSSIEAISSRLGATEFHPVFRSTSPRLSRIYLLRFPQGTDLLSLIKRYRSDPGIEYIQLNHLYRPCGKVIPNDPRFQEQWDMDRIRMPEAWSIEKGSEEVVIAIIDTGVNYEHEDIKSKIWRNPGEIPGNGVDDDGNGFTDDYIGWDFVDAPTMPGKGDYTDWDNDPMDEGGHGSHVAGIAGAQPDNSIGIAGVAWNCRIMPIRAGFRVLVGGTYLQDDDAAAAIVYASDNGARVINMSWGAENPSPVIRDALDYAYRRGCILVAAAGNDSRTDILYPAAYREVIAVAASDQRDRKAYFSNSNAAIDIAAPGMVILSLGVTDPYWVSSGTSMAAPHVSGVAALLISRRPDLTPEDVRRIIVASADKMSDSPELVDAGRLNAFRALLTTTPLIARITSPENNSGFDSSIKIIGTVGGYRFGSYQLLYGFGKTPERWFPITPSLGQSVESGQLGIWDVSRIKEGVYTIRLEVRSADKMEISRDEAIVVVDHSSPAFKSIKLRRSIYRDRYETELLWQTDDQTITEVLPKPMDSDTLLTPIKLSQLARNHRLPLSRVLSDGVYEICVKAINLAGLSAEMVIEATVVSEPIPPTTFTELPSYRRSFHPAEGFTDIDRDGAPEIWGMIGSNDGYGEIAVFEVDRNGRMREIRKLGVRAFPWWVGDINRNGRPEILLNEGDLTFLLEGKTRIFEREGVWGGIVADTDRDGKLELLLKEEQHNQVQIYEYTGYNSFLKTASLGNSSPGYNSIRYIVVGDVEGDGMTDILFLDEDCDLVFYESRGDNAYTLGWVERVDNEGMPAFLTAGDVRGDEGEEVLLGVLKGEEHEEPVYTLRLKLLSVRHDGPRLLEERDISDAISISNTAKIADLDGDRKGEIIVATYRNLYVLNGKLEPIWHFESAGENHRIAVDVNGDGRAEFGLNLKDGFRFFVREKDTSLKLKPWGLKAVPLDETTIKLTWDGEENWRKFNVYRAEDDEGGFHRIGTVIGRSFTDSGLNPDCLYRYAVTTVLGDWESEMSEPVELKPSPPPELSSINPIPPGRIILEFSEEMSLSVRRVSSYELNEVTTAGGIKSPLTPSSALLISPKKVLLSFPDNPLKPGHVYMLTISSLSAKTGAPMGELTIRFEIPMSKEVFTDLSSLEIYPNPVSLERGAPRVIFDHLPPKTRISIYTIDGNLIVDLPPAGEDGVIRWNLLNKSSNLVASGVYIYIAHFKGQIRTGKIAVVR